jgi:5'-nucleotidase
LVVFFTRFYNHHVKKRSQLKGAMKLLITNDDGIHSQGLKALAKRLRSVGEVSIVAPDRERNAAGHSITLHKPLRVQPMGLRTFSVNGTPTDCVNLAVNGILKQKPDLVISGINKGGNLGDDITYSGTVSGAMESTILGIPSVAVSQVGEEPYHFDAAARVVARLARLIQRLGLSQDTFLNVNVPNLPLKAIRGVRITGLGKRIFDSSMIVKKTDPRGREYYWIGENRVKWEPRKNTDHEAIEQGFVSVTPIHMDLTNYSVLGHMRSWESVLSRRKAKR